MRGVGWLLWQVACRDAPLDGALKRYPYRHTDPYLSIYYLPNAQRSRRLAVPRRHVRDRAHAPAVAHMVPLVT